ncbi:unnamed protein product [Brassicogethes aeneus]|uniref:Endonuclease/exonuclease/phosphatase family domain-containing protein 1 n=1 Tax=Brassicogethes aeneus TaxID=1431903 RepID=A0A9P0FK64_BRAAE|nr:unnamed protein product [Brassicogethes aeneus]
MGQSSSLPKGRRKSLRSWSRKTQNSRSNLSHTFNIIENDDKPELMNINLATEEELMTLPNINREIAKNIVDHRREIGRFRKVEDLALVRGVGATKLEQIRPEICVSTKINHSCSSSRAQSYDSLKSTDSRVTIKSMKPLNINKATIFELQGVNGITQEVAAAIISYRTKKGLFKKVDDLIKVKLIDTIRLDNISRYLTIENCDVSPMEFEGTPRPSILTNGYTMPAYGNNNRNGGPLTMPISNGLSLSSAVDIFELLSAYSPRPIVEEIFRYNRNGQAAIRVAIWNLHQLSNEKASNFGVKEVICRTILENGLSIIAVQDILSVTALKSICEELNNPKLRRIREWRDKNHNWNFCMVDVHTSKLGFIYDSGGAIDIDLTSLNEGPEETKKHCEVLIATFSIGSINLQLVNMVLFQEADIPLIENKFKEFLTEDRMVVLLVDSSTIQNPDNFISIESMKPVLPVNTNTNYITSKSELSFHRSNIFTSKKVQDHLTNFSGVIRHGITHLSIPNGWAWGGPVSPHCPLWTELFLSSNVDMAL